MTDYEKAFRDAGLPSFIADRTAGQDVWRRALPLMGLVFFVEVLGAVDLKLSFWANVGLEDLKELYNHRMFMRMF